MKKFDKCHNSWAMIRNLFPVVLLFVLFLNGPAQAKKAIEPDYSWYVDKEAPLVYEIEMLSKDKGFATARGRGKNVEGHVYNFENGEWQSILSFDYSDFPAIYATRFRGEIHLWAFNHLTHNGAYKPVMNFYNGRSWIKQTLPKIMWDDFDYSMFFALDGQTDRNVMAVGQKGHIIHFDGTRWKEQPSPIKWNSQMGTYDSDIRDVVVLENGNAWACGSKGQILHNDGRGWVVDTVFAALSEATIMSMDFSDAKHGFAVTGNGYLLRYLYGQWSLQLLNKAFHFEAVKAFNENDIWLGGSYKNKSLLVQLSDTGFKRYSELESLSGGVVHDIDGFWFEKEKRHKIWLAMDRGIVTNSSEHVVTFTNVTRRFNLPTIAIGSVFTDIDADGDSDALLMSDGQAPYRLFINNNSAGFAEFNLDTLIASRSENVSSIAVGDVENDGRLDIVLFDNSGRPLMLHQYGDLLFRIERHPGFRSIKYDGESWICSRFWDYNADGYADLFFGGENGGLNVCLNDGFGNFPEHMTLNIPLKSNQRLIGVTPYDHNADGLIDLYLVYNLVGGELWLNQGQNRFQKVADSRLSGMRDAEPFAGVFQDFNRDRAPDIYTYVRKGKSAVFTGKQRVNPGIEEKIDFGGTGYHYYWSNGVASAADANNDFLPDLYISNMLFVNQDSDTLIRLLSEGNQLHEGNSSWSDIDNDGDLDVFIGSAEIDPTSGMKSALLQNNLENKKTIRLKFNCSENNRPGIGSWIWVFKGAGNRSYCAERLVGFEGSSLIAEDFNPVTIPVDQDTLYRVIIRFPNGKMETFSDISTGEIYEIRDTSLLNFALAGFVRQIRLAFFRCEWIPELLKLLLLIGGVLLFIRKFRYSEIITGKMKIYSIAGIVLLYAVYFILMGEAPYTLPHWIVYSLFPISLLLTPYLSEMVVKKTEHGIVADYRLVAEIGEGGMGKVYKARSAKTKQIVALKVLHPGVMESEEGRKRFDRECRIGETLKHENIVQILDSGTWQDISYLVMEFLEGRTLRAELQKHGPFPVRKALSYTISIARALGKIHQNNIVHRDIKSENVFLTNNNVIKLMDFGLAKSAIFTMATKTNVLLGTLAYMSPQQAVGEDVDHRSDIYSLGVVLYEMITGRLPFSGQHDMALIYDIFRGSPASAKNLRPEIPDVLDKFISKSMAKEVEDRHQSTQQMIMELQTIYNEMK